jgi:hypothetical protein
VRRWLYRGRQYGYSGQVCDVRDVNVSTRNSKV